MSLDEGADLVLPLEQAHAVEGEVVLDGVGRIEPAQAAGDVERHRPAGGPVAREPDPPRDRVDVGIERDHQAGRVHRPPEPEVDAVAPGHPAQVEVQALARAAVHRGGKEEPHAGAGRELPPPVQAPMVEGQRARGERGEGRAHVGGVRSEAAGEEALHRARLLEHLPDEEEQAGHVAAVVEAVPEAGQPPRGRTRVEVAHGPRRPLAQRPERGSDAALDLDDVSVGQGGRQEADHLAVLGRSLGEALDVTTAMVNDPGCRVVLTLSGAMTIAKMGKVICKMIDSGMVQAVVSTGALMAHGLSEAVGMVHYRYDPRMSDEELFDKGYNRVYDTLEMEANLNYVEEFTSRALDTLTGELSSEIICRALGRILAEEDHGAGVLRSA